MDFSNFGANQAMIDSTLDKFTPGEVFDDLIVTNFGVCFGSIAHARAYARQKQVFLNLASVIPLDVEEKYIVRREYLDLEFKEIAKDSSFVVKNLVAEKSSWINVIEAIWGSVENYIQNGSGIGLFDGDIQVAEAVVGFIGRKNWEIGTITHENYRGRGLSTLASSILVKNLTEKGIRPSWSCNEDNVASYRVAEKIGFRRHKTYYYYQITPG